MDRSDDVLMNTNGNSFVSSMQNGDLNSISINNTANSNINTSNNGSGSNGLNGSANGPNSASNGNEQRPANVYTMPGILHYLQHEWNRFEFERQQWDVERSELMVSLRALATADRRVLILIFLFKFLFQDQDGPG